MFDITAIFAYVDNDIAFIASDTKRGILGFNTIACKTQRWSENVLISQTGFGEGLQRLVGEMLSWQHRSHHLLCGKGLVAVFKKLAPVRLAAEISMLKHHTGHKGVAGTLVVAENSRAGATAQIFTLDWGTGKYTPQPGPVYADGTNQPAFLTIATAQFTAMGSGGIGFDLAAWAKSCIVQSKAHHSGGAVDWPADLTICRTDKGIPVSLVQRVQGPSSPTHPIFII